MGSIPRSITVLAMDDLADLCKAGDDVYASGVIIRRWRPLIPGSRCELEMAMEANNLQVANEDKARLSVTEDITCHQPWA